MRAYISVSYNQKNNLKDELQVIKNVCKDLEIAPFIFVNEFSFSKYKSKELMNKTLEEIRNSDILICETTFKEIGIGIEAGYAKALDKPIIYLRKEQAEQSTTLSGIADYSIIYKDISDLELTLKKILIKL